LATLVSQTCAARGEPAPAGQLLLYPAVDRKTRYASLEKFADGFFLTRADIDWFLERYAPGVDLADPRISPLFGTLVGLPPTVVVTAGCDPLRDEGEAYAARLEKAGNCVLLRRMRGHIHGFLNLAGVSPSAHAALIEVAEVLRDLSRSIDSTVAPPPARRRKNGHARGASA
jgi:acetyl esterase